MLLGGLSVVLTTLFQVWSPWLVRQAVDHVQAGVTRTALLRDAALILLAVLLQGLFLYTMRMTLIRTSRRMEYELRNDLFDHRLRAHPSDPELGAQHQAVRERGNRDGLHIVGRHVLASRKRGVRA